MRAPESHNASTLWDQLQFSGTGTANFQQKVRAFQRCFGICRDFSARFNEQAVRRGCLITGTGFDNDLMACRCKFFNGFWRGRHPGFPVARFLQYCYSHEA